MNIEMKETKVGMDDEGRICVSSSSAHQQKRRGPVRRNCREENKQAVVAPASEVVRGTERAMRLELGKSLASNVGCSDGFLLYNRAFMQGFQPKDEKEAIPIFCSSASEPKSIGLQHWSVTTFEETKARWWIDVMSQEIMAGFKMIPVSGRRPSADDSPAEPIPLTSEPDAPLPTACSHCNKDFDEAEKHLWVLCPCLAAAYCTRSCQEKRWPIHNLGACEPHHLWVALQPDQKSHIRAVWLGLGNESDPLRQRKTSITEAELQMIDEKLRLIKGTKASK